MSIYEIITVPDPVLKETAQPVARIDEAIRAQAEAMLATMYAAPGIGLAANQVGLLNRIFVMDVAPDAWEYGPEENGVLTIRSTYRDDKESGEELPPRNPLVMINPEILWSSEQHSVFEEGCLSIPQQYAEIERPAKVRVKYLDREGAQQEMEAAGLISHCIQHELDHLNGTLFIDYLSPLKRNMIVRKVEKLKKQQVL